MFGVTDFNVYDAGLTTGFVDTLNGIKDRAITFKILPWNLPNGLVGEEAIKVLVQVYVAGSRYHIQGRLFIRF
jgi:hypothetical protein